jgi:Tfp pilus assembly protein PilE
MKKKRTTIIKIIIYSIVLLILACIIAFITKSYFEREEIQDVKSNLLSVQCMCKLYKQGGIVNNVGNNVIGVKLSDCNNDIINNFKSKNIIDPSEYDKYYVLSNEDLNTLKTNIEPKSDLYYLINYDTWEVITTQGYKGAYKLSDIMNLK